MPSWPVSGNPRKRERRRLARRVQRDGGSTAGVEPTEMLQMQQNVRPLGFAELGHVQLLDIDGAVVEVGMHPVILFIYIIHDGVLIRFG